MSSAGLMLFYFVSKRLVSKIRSLFTLTRATLVTVAAVSVLAACGKASSSDGEDTLNDAGSGGAGAPSGGSPAFGGMPSGGADSHSAGAAGVDTSGGAPASTVDCDPRKIVCKRVAPICTGDQVPSVDGACYGPCVDIDRCACTEAKACPEEERFTCHMNRMHCGPYVR